MLKTLKSKISPFGGIYLIHDKFLKAGVGKFIDKELGHRVKNYGYKYSDIFLTRVYTKLCGGDAAEDVNYIREHTLKHLQGMDIPSPDTLLRCEKELATECSYVKTDSGTENKVNVNEKMNHLLTAIAARFGGLTKAKDLVYDYDNQFIPAEKHDATYSYKKQRGYFPGIVSIGGLPVYLEGRNGNCNVKTDQLSTHKRALTLLNEQGIKPTKARMDSGSYIKALTDYFEGEEMLFYIRANSSDILLFEAASTDGWHECTIGYQDYEVNSFDYKFGSFVHRIVAYRRPNKTGQANLITADAKNYLFIITNDREMTDEEVICFYNARGESEKVFDIQNNDFGWSAMPHSFLEENTVYLIIMAITHILYKYLLTFFSKFIQGLTTTSRLKRFIFRVVVIPAKWVRTARKSFLRIALSNDKLFQAMGVP